MKCPDYEILSAYFDGEVQSPWDTEIKEHLVNCEGCRERLESLNRLSGVLNKDSEPDITVLKMRVYNNITQNKKSPKRSYVPFWKKSIPIPVPLVFAISIILIVFSFLFIFNLGVSNNNNQLTVIKEKESGLTEEVKIKAGDTAEIEALLEALGKKGQAGEVIIKLPDGKNFLKVGESTIMRAVDFKRNSKN